MQELTIRLPFGVSENEAKLYLAMKLFEEGKLSLGQAAALAEYSKVAFMEILGKYHIPVFNYPPEELEQDVTNA